MAEERGEEDSSRRVTIPEPEDTCELLSADTLVFEHYGPRVVSLGLLTRRSAARGPMSIQKRVSEMKSIKHRGFSSMDLANRSVDLSAIKAIASRTHFKRTPHSIPTSSSPLDLTTEELNVYEDFVALLKTLPKDAAVELLHSAHHDAELT